MTDQSPAAQPSLQHHQTPRFALRHFGSSELLELRISDERRWRRPISRATVEKGLYHFPGLAGTVVDNREGFLQQIESRAAPVLSSIVRGGWPLAPADRLAFSRFLAAARLRTRSTLARIQQGVFVAVTADNDPDGWLQKYPNVPGGIRVSFPQEIVGAMLYDGSIDPNAQVLMAMSWHLLAFDRSTLITSDQPVCRWSGYFPDPGNWRGFFQSARGLCFPLTPRLGLILSNKSSNASRIVSSNSAQDDVIQGTPWMANILRQHIVRNAQKYVYANLSDGDLLDDAVRYLRTLRREPSVVGFPA